MLQFSVNDPTFDLTENESKLSAKFTLRRNPTGLILNSYIPSFSIMVMTIVPLYLREEIHFTTTIMLVLTSMLCLYTLFQSSSSEVPQTAYLKFIDYWNILSLVISLINFFILITWEICHDKQENITTWRRIKNIMRIIIPVLTLLAVTCYGIVAFILYSE